MLADKCVGGIWAKQASVGYESGVEQRLRGVRASRRVLDREVERCAVISTIQLQVTLISVAALNGCVDEIK